MLLYANGGTEQFLGLVENILQNTPPFSFLSGASAFSFLTMKGFSP
jgi:hypothetical protein